MIADPFDTPPPITPSALAEDPGAFDALADLFLGTMGGVAAHDTAMGMAPRTGRAATNASAIDDPASAVATRAETDRPRLTLVGDLNPGREAAPSPMPRERHADHAASNGPARRTAPVHASRGTRQPTIPTVPPPVEAVILGHLPVMASAWASQYVRHVADRVQGPVAMARLSAGRVRIEVVAPAGGSHAATHAPTLEAALAMIGDAARRVVIFGDAECEMRAARTPGVERVTLLSSGDEAGIVAAYSIVKRLAERPESTGHHAGHEPQSAAAKIHVAVLGAPPARSEYVLDRLDKACRTFLSLPLKRDACIARIGTGSVGVEVFEGPLDAPVEDFIAMLAVGRVPAMPAASAFSGQSPPEPDDEFIEPAPAPEMPVARRQPIATAALRHETHEPAATPAHEPTAHGIECPTNPEGALASLVDGLEALEARCPAAPEVEIAIAECGTLHVLARAEAYGDPGRALIRLEAAAGWARLNRRVLALTLSPRHRATSRVGLAGASVVTHLFTDQPAHWRTLLDGNIRLHVMLPVVAAVGGWACAAMN